jgi:hypothetical protein
VLVDPINPWGGAQRTFPIGLKIFIYIESYRARTIPENGPSDVLRIFHVQGIKAGHIIAGWSAVIIAGPHGCWRTTFVDRGKIRIYVWVTALQSRGTLCVEENSDQFSMQL